MFVYKFSLLEKFVGNLSPKFLDLSKHLVVRGTGEDKFASVEFENCAPKAPHIDLSIIW